MNINLINMSFKDSNEARIVDSFKWRIYGALPCVGCFYYTIIMFEISVIFNISLSSVADPPNIAPINRLLQALIIIPVSTIPFLFTNFLIKTHKPFEKRFFLINKEKIQITVPNKEVFRINWDEFDALHIIQKKEPHGSADYRVYFLYFIKEENSRSFKIEATDFRRKTVKEIFRELKKFSNQMNKEYMVMREEKKSGRVYRTEIRI